MDVGFPEFIGRYYYFVLNSIFDDDVSMSRSTSQAPSNATASSSEGPSRATSPVTPSGRPRGKRSSVEVDTGD